MKKTKLALMATLVLALTFTACGKGGDAKLMESININTISTNSYDESYREESSKVQRFEYDKQNRIVKIDDKTITYADNLITVGTEKYVINGNTITVGSNSFAINGDGYIVKYYDGVYEYKDGNLIKISWSSRGEEAVYSYDNKKSPCSNCNTPKWLIQLLFPNNRGYASKNNVLYHWWGGDADHGGYAESTGDYTYEYEYDSDGFPVKSTMTLSFEGNEETVTTYYTYRGGTQNATAKTETAAREATETKPPETTSESQPSGEEKCPDKESEANQ